MLILFLAASVLASSFVSTNTKATAVFEYDLAAGKLLIEATVDSSSTASTIQFYQADGSTTVGSAENMVVGTDDTKHTYELTIAALLALADATGFKVTPATPGDVSDLVVFASMTGVVAGQPLGMGAITGTDVAITLASNLVTATTTAVKLKYGGAADIALTVAPAPSSNGQGDLTGAFPVKDLKATIYGYLTGTENSKTVNSLPFALTVPVATFTSVKTSATAAKFSVVATGGNHAATNKLAWFNKDGSKIGSATVGTLATTAVDVDVAALTADGFFFAALDTDDKLLSTLVGHTLTAAVPLTADLKNTAGTTVTPTLTAAAAFTVGNKVALLPDYKTGQSYTVTTGATVIDASLAGFVVGAGTPALYSAILDGTDNILTVPSAMAAATMTLAAAAAVSNKVVVTFTITQIGPIPCLPALLYVYENASTIPASAITPIDLVPTDAAKGVYTAEVDISTYDTTKTYAAVVIGTAPASGQAPALTMGTPVKVSGPATPGGGEDAAFSSFVSFFFATVALLVALF